MTRATKARAPKATSPAAKRAPARPKLKFTLKTVDGIEFALIVPSRKRVHNMALLRSMLPEALILVDERELPDYQPFLPKELLWTHPPFEGQPRIINWVMDQPEMPPIIVFCDDDLKSLQYCVGSCRRTRDPVEIRAIIENAIRNARDLDISVFGFSRVANPAMSNVMPIRGVGPICAIFGVRGNARHRKFDLHLPGRNDIDWTLRTMLDDRIAYLDFRFYFDFGPCFAGRGGNTGLTRSEEFAHSTRALKEKWGKHVSFKQPNFQKNRSTQAMSIRVPRRNKTANK